MPSDVSQIAQLAKSLDKFAKVMGDEGASRIAKVMGEEAQTLAARAAAADLGGDTMMSGWPVTRLDTRVKLVEPGVLILAPASRAAAAGWTTATLGRNQGNAAGFSGPGLNHRTGVTSRSKTGKIVDRKAKARRWNGTTRGKGTARDAWSAIERAMPKVIDRELKKLLGRAFD